MEFLNAIQEHSQDLIQDYQSFNQRVRKLTLNISV